MLPFRQYGAGGAHMSVGRSAWGRRRVAQLGLACLAGGLAFGLPGGAAVGSTAWAATGSFDEWLKGLRSDARTEGIRAQTLDAALAGVSPIARVLELDRKQP